MVVTKTRALLAFREQGPRVRGSGEPGEVLGMNQALWPVLIVKGKGAVGAVGDSVPLIIPINRGLPIFSFSS